MKLLICTVDLRAISPKARAPCARKFLVSGLDETNEVVYRGFLKSSLGTMLYNQVGKDLRAAPACALGVSDVGEVGGDDGNMKCLSKTNMLRFQVSGEVFVDDTKLRLSSPGTRWNPAAICSMADCSASKSLQSQGWPSRYPCPQRRDERALHPASG